MMRSSVFNGLRFALGILHLSFGVLGCPLVLLHQRLCGTLLDGGGRQFSRHFLGLVLALSNRFFGLSHIAFGTLFHRVLGLLHHVLRSCLDLGLHLASSFANSLRR